jgi:hypothetical protein
LCIELFFNVMLGEFDGKLLNKRNDHKRKRMVLNNSIKFLLEWETNNKSILKKIGAKNQLNFKHYLNIFQPN